MESIRVVRTKRRVLSTSDVLWHGLNFVAPMFFVGTLMALAAKMLWGRALRATPVVRLVCFGNAGACIGYTCTVAWLDRDGAIAAYAAMLISTALAIGWVSTRSRLD